MSSMDGLSKRQEAVLGFITTELSEGRACPSHREIASHFGFSSSYAAACHVRALRKKGVLVTKFGKARSLRLADAHKPLDRPVLASIPIFGSVPAGFGQEKAQEAVGSVTVDVGTIGFTPGKNTFALRVSGDSMLGKHICDGDIVVLEREREPRTGQVVAALIDGKSTLKTLILENGRSFLKAENSKYPDLIPSEELMIQGVFRALIRKANK